MKIESVDAYFQRGCGRCAHFDTPVCKVHRWDQALAALRRICLDSGLVEDLKWSHPCYTHEGRNIAILGAFNDYCSLGFLKGALLADPEKILVSQSENSQSARILRVTDAAQVAALEPTLRAYLAEAVAVEASGRKVPSRPVADFPVPEALREALDADAPLRDAFARLTPGRQKAYLLHFAQPKQESTRRTRVAKCRDRILAGLGLYDDPPG